MGLYIKLPSSAHRPRLLGCAYSQGIRAPDTAMNMLAGLLTCPFPLLEEDISCPWEVTGMLVESSEDDAKPLPFPEAGSLVGAVR